jgi:hypothetical protein
MLREQVKGHLQRSWTTPKKLDTMSETRMFLTLPTREDMIVKIKKHEKIPTLGEVLELRLQAREKLLTVGQLNNGSSLDSPPS